MVAVVNEVSVLFSLKSENVLLFCRGIIDFSFRY